MGQNTVVKASIKVINQLVDERNYCLVPKHMPFIFKRALFYLHLTDIIEVTNDVMYQYNYKVTLKNERHS